VALQEVYLDGRDGQMLVWSWYLVDGYSTANEYEAKVRQLIARLSGRFPHGFRLILTTPMRARPENAHLRLQDYLDLHGDELYQSLESATAVTP
jgi:EpsI family protein